MHRVQRDLELEDVRLDARLGVGSAERSGARTRHAVAGERAQVEPHRAVGDPLEVVCELLGQRRLARPPHLGEAGQAGPDDEPLPVRGQLARRAPRRSAAGSAAGRRGSCRRAGRSRAAGARRAGSRAASGRAASSRRACAARAPRRGRARAALRAGAQRAELEHREDAPAPADALAAVEERPPARRRAIASASEQRRAGARAAGRRAERTTSSARSSRSTRRSPSPGEAVEAGDERLLGRAA